jgi:CelD/BcsL family acetyltransferase involved in cellulose biosynthesis
VLDVNAKLRALLTKRLEWMKILHCNDLFEKDDFFEATITREDALELARNFRFCKQEVLPKGP